MAEANLTSDVSGSPAHGLPPAEIFREGVLTRAQTSEILRDLDLAPTSGERRNPVDDFKAETASESSADLGAEDEPISMKPELTIEALYAIMEQRLSQIRTLESRTASLEIGVVSLTDTVNSTSGRLSSLEESFHAVKDGLRGTRESLER